VVPEIESRASHMIGKCSITQLHLQTNGIHFYVLLGKNIPLTKSEGRKEEGRREKKRVKDERKEEWTTMG
jgi:hypothetical protein